MKHVSLLAAGLLAMAPFAAFAQDTTTFLAAQTEAEYLARDHLIGAKVHGAEGTIIADVEDLIVNDENQIVGVVLGTGGYFGFGEKKVGVALSSLKFAEEGGALVVSLPDVTKETLDGAPSFERRKPPKSLFERAKEKVHELGDKTRTSTQDAIERAQPALEQARDKAKEAIDKAKEVTAPAIERAKEAVSDALDTAKEAVDEATTPETPAPDAPAAPVAPATPEPPASNP